MGLVAGHDDRVVAFQPLGFVDTAKDAIRRYRPRIGPLTRNFGEALIGVFKLAKPDGIAEFAGG